jgi:phosphatidate phosphatase LPIN
MVGKDWTHQGIASFYTKIHGNGYYILYLTSRAIGQADITRGYLKGIEQGSHQLPDGPVLMSPDRLIAALKREVIDRRPEEFKIACLRDIKRLFGDRNPFYAGFGNRITDAMSYRAVGIPTYRIYSINSNGEVKMDFFTGYKSS